MKTENREKELWQHILDDVRAQGFVGSYGMESYLSKLTLIKDTGTKLILEYPEELLIDWVEVNYADYVVNSASRVLNGARTLEFIKAAPAEQPAPEKEEPQAMLPLEFRSTESTPADEQVEAPSSSPRARSSKRKSSARTSHFNSGLNEDYTFENFVPGSNSEFAYAAAQAIVEHPGALYNPLFIQGDCGLGKTHLLQAIGNAIRAKDEDARVLYVTSEEFTNSYIDALPNKGAGLKKFRDKYRQADVLLIDDVQFLAKKGKTQDEFFFTFNALFSSKKQIVLTADCPASEVVGMDARLTSRFEQGLSVSINPPDFETRMAILRSKSKQWRSDLIDQDVLRFLAENITRSVRRLEGALTCLSTMAAFSHSRPTIADARAQLRQFMRDEPTSNLSIKAIQQSVADAFNLRVADLNGRRRTAAIAHPRQIAMFLARHHTGSSLQDIGAAFGGRDHGTVIHATRTIEKKLETDPDLRAIVSRLRAELSA